MEYALKLNLKLLSKSFKYLLLDDLCDRELLEKQPSPYFLFKEGEGFSLLVEEAFEAHASTIDIDRAPRWRCFKTEGDMPFGSVKGLIHHISGILFAENIGTCVVSSFHSDFFFVRDSVINVAISLLIAQGWNVVYEE